MTRKLTQGNEAVFRGAIAAGASYYAGYPISPSTEILNIASGHAAEHPEFRFLQAEDEIAAANAVIGASLAGAKAFTATSGPGLALHYHCLIIHADIHQSVDRTEEQQRARHRQW